ncbi:MAG TPA: hypothetical protein VIW71_19685, partial [Streptomyces sp.]
MGAPPSAPGMPGPAGFPGPAGPGPAGPGPVGFPGAPGSGRRRRGYDPLADTGGFAVRPQDLDGPSPAHPEHREHAAWGAAGGWAPERGRGPARELAPEPVEPSGEPAAPRRAPHIQ